LLPSGVPRRLGQHFLKPASVERLLRTLHPQPGDAFLEIGPGTGALTLPLASRVRRLVAVELDELLAARLRERVPGNVTIVTGDALGVDLAGLAGGRVRLAGNLPYAISSPLLRRFLELRDVLVDAHLMLQREVAERVASPPGSRQYGILSVLYALHADVDVPLRFSPGAFTPPPRVGSALLRVRFLPRPRREVADTTAFGALLKAAFSHRRKTLENNLQDSYPNLKQYLRFLNIWGTRRAETLSVDEFVELYDALRQDERE
jgi:16S rRNA (adenine1518-N6/adenine1519-N6)-dimethyltransferase